MPNHNIDDKMSDQNGSVNLDSVKCGKKRKTSPKTKHGINNLPNIRHFASNPKVPSSIPIVHIHPSITFTVVPNLAFPLTPTNTRPIFELHLNIKKLFNQSNEFKYT